MTKTVLVAGATGLLGRKIVRQLIGRGAAVRALVRPGKTSAASELRGDGATPVEGDLFRPESLERACAAVDVVVSAVQGLGDVIVDGQTNLLRAAEAAGVTRMIPSDFSVDLFKLESGENQNLDLRREFDRRLDRSRVRGTSVLDGAFAEMLPRGFGAVPSVEEYAYWGDGEQPLDFTTTDDTAAFTAAAALDDDAPRVLRVAGESVTSKQLHALMERLLGKRLDLRCLGSVDDLAREIARQLAASEGKPPELFSRAVQLQYLHNMVSGRAKLDPLDNGRYPALRYESVGSFLRRALAQPTDRR